MYSCNPNLGTSRWVGKIIYNRRRLMHIVTITPFPFISINPAPFYSRMFFLLLRDAPAVVKNVVLSCKSLTYSDIILNEKGLHTPRFDTSLSWIWCVWKIDWLCHTMITYLARERNSASLFYSYGTSIVSSLLFPSLPNTFSMPWHQTTLVSHRYFDAKDARRRDGPDLGCPTRNQTRRKREQRNRLDDFFVLPRFQSTIGQ